MPYKVRATVISVGEHCAQGHTVGQSWVMEGTTPAGICLSAMPSLLPRFTALRFGAEFPWAEDKDTAVAACPDAKNPVVFELRRLQE